MANVTINREALQKAYEKYSLAKYLAYDAPDLDDVLALENISFWLLRLIAQNCTGGEYCSCQPCKAKRGYEDQRHMFGRYGY